MDWRAKIQSIQIVSMIFSSRYCDLLHILKWDIQLVLEFYVFSRLYIHVNIIPDLK